jgi:predicted ATP-dependent protease
MEEVPEDVRKELEIVPLTRIREVVDVALEKFVANPPPPLPPVSDRPPGPEPEPQPLMAKER